MDSCLLVAWAADDTLARMLVRRFIVAERSMAPTLDPGDRILVTDRGAVAGDLVVADDPDGRRVVKRCVAVGPASVTVAGGDLLVDGAASPWSPPEGIPADGTWDVPVDHAFLLSDAPRRTDADSRAWGPLHRDRLVGVVRWRYRPITRMGRPR